MRLVLVHRALKSRWLQATLVLMLSGCSIMPDIAISGGAGTGEKSAVVKISDSRSVKNILAKALAAVEQSDIENADLEFQLMMEQGAKSPDSLNHYAIFLREQWRLDEAEKVYKQALKNSPKDPMTHWNIAVLYELYRGDYQQALEHFKAYQQSAPEADKRVAIWVGDLTRRLEQ